MDNSIDKLINEKVYHVGLVETIKNMATAKLAGIPAKKLAEEVIGEDLKQYLDEFLKECARLIEEKNKI